MLAVAGLGAGQDHAMGRLGAPPIKHFAGDVRVELHAIGLADAKGLIGKQFAACQMLGSVGQGEALAMPLVEIIFRFK